MDIKGIFAKNLQWYMDQNGKTRRDVCDALGFNYYTFTDWIKGKKYPRMDKVEMLADYFGIQKSDLIEDKSAEEKEKPVTDDGLTESQQKLIDFAKGLSDDQADKVLRLMKSIVAFDE